MIKNIGIIGVGGVGGYFGGRLVTGLSHNPAIKIYFIARGAHLEAIQNHGLILSTAKRGEMICEPELATDQIEKLPILDICMVCVKSYDLKNTMVRLKSVIHANTLVIPLLNGVDIYERIRSVLNEGIVFPGCVYVGTHIEQPGKVVQQGGACKILFGKDPEHPNLVPREIFRLLDQSGIQYQWLDDPYPEIWKKFLFIAAFGMVGACYDRTLGQIMQDESFTRDVQSIMYEIVNVAQQKGVCLRDAEVKEALQKAEQFPPDAKCSFHRDFEQADKPDERDLFGNTIIRMAETLNVHVSVTCRISDRLGSLKQESGLKKEKQEARNKNQGRQWGN
ncbi:2-dehydropantoate 2-reductase [bacterium]|nr:2-dehydropantoate 2-reductase [bacterium]